MKTEHSVFPGDKSCCRLLSAYNPLFIADETTNMKYEKCSYEMIISNE